MKKIIAANWKMNGSVASAKDWAKGVTSSLAKIKPDVEMVVCPPFPLISILGDELSGCPIKLGGQDCHSEKNGAYTGETAAPLLKDLGCGYVIVGHSERRHLFNESDDVVKSKALCAMDSGLIPIICIGETQKQREDGKTIEVINRQIERSVPKEAASGNFVLAYEPVWAIGSGKIPTLSEIKEVHKAIINKVSDFIAIDVAQIRVLYGGSVKPDNSGEIMAISEVCGVLVGGASLKADDFVEIAMSAYSN